MCLVFCCVMCWWFWILVMMVLGVLVRKFVLVNLVVVDVSFFWVLVNFFFRWWCLVVMLMVFEVLSLMMMVWFILGLSWIFNEIDGLKFGFGLVSYVSEVMVVIWLFRFEFCILCIWVGIFCWLVRFWLLWNCCILVINFCILLICCVVIRFMLILEGFG